jgi:hypothetical protein
VVCSLNELNKKISETRSGSRKEIRRTKLLEVKRCRKWEVVEKDGHVIKELKILRELLNQVVRTSISSK